MAVFGALLRPGRSHSRYPKLTSPFQRALRQTLVGNVSHILQPSLTSDRRVTVLSIGGIGAFDHISRGFMLDGPRSAARMLPFELQFYGNPSPSSYLWDDDDGDPDQAGRKRKAGRFSDTHVVRSREAPSFAISAIPHERLLALMMCTPLHSRTGFLARSSGSTAAFRSMPARPRSWNTQRV